jgi:hypothetical protein
MVTPPTSLVHVVDHTTRPRQRGMLGGLEWYRQPKFGW